jgi:hypothetical protein
MENEKKQSNLAELVDKYSKVPVNSKGYTHSFTDLIQIIEYCRSIGITDDYLIQGLQNTIDAGYSIKKRWLL